MTDSFARSAAQVVGAVGATVVVTIASGGTLGPVAVGAMGMSGAASAAATGALSRAVELLKAGQLDEAERVLAAIEELPGQHSIDRLLQPKLRSIGWAARCRDPRQM